MLILAHQHISSKARGNGRRVALTPGELASRRGLLNYEDFLKTDFPRIPLTSDVELSRQFVAVGHELVALHLFEDERQTDSLMYFPIAGSNGVDTGHPRYVEDTDSDGSGLRVGRIYINREGQFFGNVPVSVWEVSVGGYKPCEKWLRSRRGRVLSSDEIAQFETLIGALGRTAELMHELDEIVGTHGGFPFTAALGARAPRVGLGQQTLL